jgi:hypothetical protein
LVLVGSATVDSGAVGGDAVGSDAVGRTVVAGVAGVVGGDGGAGAEVEQAAKARHPVAAMLAQRTLSRGVDVSDIN